MSKNRFDKLRRRQLDDLFEQLEPLRSVDRPRDGWLKAIRTALGMTTAQAADRVGVTKGMISRYEKAEREDSITLGTLKRVSEALGCQVVYAILPRRPISELRRERARQVARRRVESVHNSMELEDQAISENEKQHQINELTEELLNEWPREIWSEP